jgi:hypothetical protein
MIRGPGDRASCPKRAGIKPAGPVYLTLLFQGVTEQELFASPRLGPAALFAQALPLRHSCKVKALIL